MNILMYHLVGEGSGPMTVPLHRFIGQMELLAAGPERLLTEDDLHAHVRSGTPLPTDAVLLTFDDGYANTVSTVLPVLDRLGLPAVMAVCSGYLGADLPRRVRHPVQEMADLEQVRRWIDSGRDIAAHGYTHHRLPQESDLALRWQVGGDHETHANLLDAFRMALGSHTDPASAQQAARQIDIDLSPRE